MPFIPWGEFFFRGILGYYNMRSMAQFAKLFHQTSRKKRLVHGYYLMALGIVLICIAYFMQQVFLSGTGFKEEYKRRQQKQCQERNGVRLDCLKLFPL